MADELNNQAPQDASAAIGASELSTVQVDEKALGDIYDKLMADDAAGSSRDEAGRFKAKQSPDPVTGDNGAAPGQSEAEASEEKPFFSERQVQPAALPPNWPKDKADAFNAIPEIARGPVQEVLQGLHAKMSDQGRALSTYREFDPILADMKANYPEHFTGPEAKTPAQVVDYLYGWQKALDTQPVAALLKIAENYGVMPQLVAHFTQAGQQGGAPAPAPAFDAQAALAQVEKKFMSMFSPEKIEQQVASVMTKSQTQDAIAKFAADKPHWSDVEATLPDFIKIAKAQQPEAAPLALLEAAYDMAVHANPATRAKLAAAAPAAAAQQSDAKRIAEAKAANQLNVKTTPSGKGKPKTEEEALGAAYDRVMSAA